MKKHSYRHTGVHKNLARLDFIRSINPVVAEKLKGMMQEHKAKERGK
ncbi:hypothetical protein AAAW53_001604 [Cronobacter sakazakii]|nr:hypothetical protein [Cronobacter sakazakii]